MKSVICRMLSQSFVANYVQYRQQSNKSFHQNKNSSTATFYQIVKLNAINNAHYSYIVQHCSQVYSSKMWLGENFNKASESCIDSLNYINFQISWIYVATHSPNYSLSLYGIIYNINIHTTYTHAIASMHYIITQYIYENEQ